MFTNAKDEDKESTELPADDSSLEPDPEAAEHYQETFPDDNSGKEEGLEVFPFHEGLSLVYKPFFTAGQPNLQDLEAVPGKEEPLVLEEISDDVIEERDGVPYIKEAAIETKSQDLNKDFKKLVDSVIN
jgi:hypothetical protein